MTLGTSAAGQVGPGRKGLTLVGPPEGRGPVATTEGHAAKKNDRELSERCRSGPSLGQDRHEEETVRDLILKMAISIDGFVSDLDGRNTWMFGADQEAKAWAVEYIWNASLHIMGSRSFHGMAA